MDSTRLNKDVLLTPKFAIPTISLFLGLLILWTMTIIGLYSGSLSFGVSLILLTVFQYYFFAPLHDASHRSVSKVKILNDLIGTISAYIIAFGPYPAFKHAHLMHHKHTNEEPEFDPDSYSSPRGKIPLLLRVMTQDLFYYYWYGKKLFQRPVLEVITIILTVIFSVCLVTFLLINPITKNPTLILLLSHRFSLMLLAYNFDYLPHRPHNKTAKESQFLATSNLYLNDKSHFILSVLLLNQNYHLMHHLQPGIPFYNYGRAWKLKEKELVKKGGKFIHILNHQEVYQNRESVLA